MKRVGAFAVAVFAMLAVGAGTAAASNNYAALGGVTPAAQINRSNVTDLVSNTGNVPTSDDYSGLYRPLLGKTFAGLTNLSTDYYVQAGDCAGGSPRFQLEVDMNNDGNVDGNIFVYIGDPASFNCPQSLQRWVSTGNLLGGPVARFDSSQLAGGGYGKTYAQTLATFGSRHVLYVDLVADGGWAIPGGLQDVLVDNPVYNTTELGNPFGGASTVAVPTRHYVYDMLSNTADVPTSNDFSALVYTQTKPWVLGDVTKLSTDYSVQTGDCAGGAPRFSITLAAPMAGKHVFVYVGNAPAFNCPLAFQRWQSTGNLLTTPDLRVDTSQLPGGTFYDTWAHALTLAGAVPVVQASIAVDAGWAFPGGIQDVWVDDVNVQVAGGDNILTTVGP